MNHHVICATKLLPSFLPHHDASRLVEVGVNRSCTKLVRLPTVYRQLGHGLTWAPQRCVIPTPWSNWFHGRSPPIHPCVFHTASLIERQLALDDTRLLVKESIVIILAQLVTGVSKASRIIR